MLKKFLLIGTVIIASNFGIFATSEAAQTDSEDYRSDSYCDDYNDKNCEGGYCSYGKGRDCR